MSNQFIGLGGGLYEVTQIERQQKGWLKILLYHLLEKNNKVLLQTRSPAITHTLSEIDEGLRRKVLVVMGFFSIENQLASRFEPNIASPSERLQSLSTLRLMGYSVGANLMPLIPTVNGDLDLIETSFKLFKEHGAGFTLHGWGDKETLERMHFEINNPVHRFREDEDRRFKNVRDRYQNVGMPSRIPHAYFRDWLNEKERISVALRYLYYYHLFKEKGREAYKLAAYHIARLHDKEWSALKDQSQTLTITGVGPKVEKIIWEFLKGEWSFLDSLERKLMS